MAQFSSLLVPRRWRLGFFLMLLGSTHLSAETRTWDSNHSTGDWGNGPTPNSYWIGGDWTNGDSAVLSTNSLNLNLVTPIVADTITILSSENMLTSQDAIHPQTISFNKLQFNSDSLNFKIGFFIFATAAQSDAISNGNVILSDNEARLILTASSAISGGTQTFQGNLTGLVISATHGVSGGTQEFSGRKSFLRANSADSINGGIQTFSGTESVLEAVVANAILSGTQNFTGDQSGLRSVAANGLNGGLQNFSGLETHLGAEVANAVTGGTQEFSGVRSNLAALVAGSVNGGTQNFSHGGAPEDAAQLRVTGSNAVIGGTQNFTGQNTSTLITGDGGVGGGTQNFLGDGSHMVVQDNGKVTGGTRNFSGPNSYFAVNTGSAVTGGTTYLQGLGKMTINAENGTTKDSSLVMQTVTGTTNVLELNGVNTTMGALSGSGGTIRNTGTAAARLTLDFDTTSATFGGRIENGTGQLALTKAGSGQLTLQHINAYSGGTILKGGELVVAADFALGSGNVHLDGGNLTFSNQSFTQSFVADAGGGTVNVQGTTSSVTGLSGNGSLTKIGGGNLILTGGISIFGGDLHINEGALTIFTGKLLQIGNGTAAAGTLSGNVVNDGSLVFNRAGNSTYSGDISGAGVVEYKSGTVKATGNSSYTGGTLIDGGTLEIGSNGAMSNTGTVTILGGGIRAADAERTLGFDFHFSGSFTLGRSTNISGNMSLLSDVTINSDNPDVSSPGMSWLFGDITGGHSLTFTEGTNGIGTIKLSGNNSYNGGTTFAGGVVQVDSAGAIGTAGTLTFTGGTLKFSENNNTDYSSRFSHANNQQFRLDTAGREVIVGDVLTGNASSLTKLGDGTLSITSFNDYGGGTFLEGGVIGIFNDVALGSGRITAHHGAIRAAGARRTLGNALTLDGLLEVGRVTDFTGEVTLASSSTISTNNGDGPANDDSVFSGQINGDHSLTIAEGLNGIGTGAIVLSNSNNSYTGGTILKSGRLAISNNGQLGSGALTFDGGVLKTTAGVDLSRTLQISSGNGIFDGQNFNSTFQSIQGTGRLTKNGSGDLTMTGDSVFVGELFIGEGTFHIGAGRTLQFGNGGNTGRLTGSISSSGTLVFNRSDDATNAGNTNGGAFRQDGLGRLTLTGSNNFTAGITIASSTLAVGSADALGSEGTINFAGGVLQLTAANHGDYSSRFSNADYQQYRIDTGGQGVLLNSTLSSNGGVLTKLGAGVLTMIATGSYTGGTVLNEGTLRIENSHALGSGVLQINGGDIRASLLPRFLPNDVNLNGNFTLGRETHFLGATTLSKNVVITSYNPDAGTGGTSSFSGPISGTHSITLEIGSNATGVMAFTGTNTYSGGTILNGGILEVNSDVNLGDVNSALAFGGGTLRTMGNVTTGSRAVLIGESGGTVDASGGNLNISNFITSGTVGLVKTGTNMLTFERTLAVLGMVHAQQGTVKIKNSGFSSGTASLDAGTTLNFEGFGGANIDITGNGSLLVSGTTANETVVFTGSATHTGGTTIQNATLQLGLEGGEFPGGTLAGDVVNNGTLYFHRFAPVTFGGVISGTGTVALNTSGGSNYLRLTASNSYSGGTDIGFGTLRVAHNNALGTGKVTVYGDLLVEGGVTLFTNEVIYHEGSMKRVISGSLAHALDATSSLNYGAPVPTTAALLDGVISGTTTLVTSFSSTSAASNDSLRRSDIYHFEGTDSAIFVLELSFTSVAENSYLGWLSNGGWKLAVDGNTGNNAITDMLYYQGSFADFQLEYGMDLSTYIGAFGRSATGGKEYVWAVLDHNSEFAAIPEPSTWMLLGFGALMLGVLSRRAKRES